MKKCCTRYVNYTMDVYPTTGLILGFVSEVWGYCRPEVIWKAQGKHCVIFFAMRSTANNCAALEKCGSCHYHVPVSIKLNVHTVDTPKVMTITTMFNTLLSHQMNSNPDTLFHFFYKI